MEPESLAAVPRFNVDAAPWQPLEAYNGSQAILYRSPDGTRVAAMYRESGVFTYTFPFDEMVYVVAGSAQVSVTGGEAFEQVPGDFCYFRQGQTVAFDVSDDFQSVAFLVSDTPISY